MLNQIRQRERQRQILPDVIYNIISENIKSIQSEWHGCCQVLEWTEQPDGGELQRC